MDGNNNNLKLLIAARIIGALSIACAGLAQLAGYPEIGQILMVMAAGAASPK